MTKFQRKLFESWKAAPWTSVREAYSKPSTSKLIAEDYIYFKSKKSLLNAREFRVPSRNTYNFTYAFLYDSYDGTIHLQYHTRTNVYDFTIDEEEY